MSFAQALGEHRLTDPMRLAVVTNRLHEVSGEAVIAPERATVLGPCAVIPQEYPEVACRSIDVVLPEADSPEERALIEEIVAEVDRPPARVVAYRGPNRWVRAYEPVRIEITGGAAAASPAPWRVSRHGRPRRDRVDAG